MTKNTAEMEALGDLPQSVAVSILAERRMRPQLALAIPIALAVGAARGLKVAYETRPDRPRARACLEGTACSIRALPLQRRRARLARSGAGLITAYAVGADAGRTLPGPYLGHGEPPVSGSQRCGVAVRSQRALSQSPLPAQRLWSGHGPHAPPQSTSVSF